jgi:ketosteroid isomerase-like protein
MRVLSLALVIAIVAAGGCARAARPMSMASFRDAYVAEVRAEQPSASMKVVADDVVEVTKPDQQTFTAYLDNAYAFYRQEPGQLRSILKHYVGELLAARGDTAFTAEQLRVLVRPASYLSITAADKPLLSRPVAGDLIVIVAVDEPTKYLYPPAAQLRATLKLGDDAIWTRALGNTARKLPGIPAQDGKKSIAALTTGEGLAASLLAEPGYWDTPALKVGGPPVVAPVAKDMVFLTHLGDASGVAAVRKMAAESVNDPEGLTDQLFVRRNGAWEVLPP